MNKRIRPDDVTAECWQRLHFSCTGYTEPSTDPELCNCACHDEQERAYKEQS